MTEVLIQQIYYLHSTGSGLETFPYIQSGGNTLLNHSKDLFFSNFTQDLLSLLSALEGSLDSTLQNPANEPMLSVSHREQKIVIV